MSCECDQPGECKRHGIVKTPKQHSLCGDPSRPGYWEAWESGSGPGQGVRGAGDIVARAILAASRGRIKPCDGCKQRQAALNALTADRQPK
jgi:hypothetical protein